MTEAMPTYRAVLTLRKDVTIGDVLEAIRHLCAGDQDEADDCPSVTVRGPASMETATDLRAMRSAGIVLHYAQAGAVDRWEIPEDAFARGLQEIVQLTQEQEAGEGWFARDLRQIEDGPLEKACRMMEAEWIRAMTPYPTRPEVSPPAGARENARQYLARWGLQTEELLGQSAR